MLIAKCLRTRLIIVQCSQFALVCMYVGMYVYMSQLALAVVALAHRHDMHMVTLTLMKASTKWTLMSTIGSMATAFWTCA